MAERTGHRQRWLWNGAVPVLLLVIALVPRVMAFGTMANPDEITWLNRTVAFYDALARGDWAATLQSRHPGVIPMWGFGALLLARYGVAQLRAWQLADTLPYAEMARTALFFPLLVSVLTVLAVYGLMRRLAGREVALCSALLLALEPYYLAYTHTIHLDLLLTSLMLIAALLWLNYLQAPRQWSYLVGGGVVAGLALLSRTGAIFLLPFSLLAIGAYFLAEHLRGSGLCLRAGWPAWLLRTSLAWLGWLALLLLTVFALWPALWTVPATVIEILKGGAEESIAAAHPGQVFFLGQVIDHDPGMRFYLLVIFFRLPPLTLVLSALNPLLFVLAWRRLSAQRRAAWGLGLAYVLFFFLQMSLALGKLERYLLPIVPALTILSGTSLALVVRWATDRFHHWRNRAVPEVASAAVLVIMIVLLAIPWLGLAPDFGAYFSPLAGGGPRAVELFTVGSGGAPGLVADYLNGLPDAEELEVQSFYPRVLRSYVKGEVKPVGWQSWAGLPVTSDYVVITLGQIQRQLDGPTLAFFLPRQPEYTARLNDLDYAWVYRVPRRVQSAPPALQRPLQADFEGRVQLLGYDLDQAEDELRLTLYWQPTASLYRELTVPIRLSDDAGRVVAESHDPPWSGDVEVLSWPDGVAVRDEHRLPLPTGLAPGEYHLSLSLEERDDEGEGHLLRLAGEEGTQVTLGPLSLGSP